MGSKLLEWHGAIEAKFLNEINVYTSVGSFEWAASHPMTISDHFCFRSPRGGKLLVEGVAVTQGRPLVR